MLQSKLCVNKEEALDPGVTFYSLWKPDSWALKENALGLAEDKHDVLRLPVNTEFKCDLIIIVCLLLSLDE